jgi:hypothetical protein
LTGTTIREVCETLWALEAEHGLLDLEVGGVKIWVAERMPVFYAICESLGLYDKPHAAAPGLLRRVRNGLTLALRAVTRNPFLAAPGMDLLVFPHSRVRREDGRRVDVYTDGLVRRARGQGRRVLAVQGRFQLQDAGLLSGPGVRCAEFLYLLTGLLRLTRRRIPLDAEAARTVAEVERALRDRLGVTLDLNGRLARRAALFVAARRSYGLLLRRLRPKEVVLTVAYWMAPLTAAARDLGIPVTEVQHGVMTRYHLGYSYPGRKEPPAYFPDRFLSWGPYWTESMPFPLPPEAVTVVGFDHFRATRERYRQVAKIPGRIVVISQGAIGPRLADLIWRNRAALEGYDVVYKLHPGEYDRWRSYEALVGLSGLKNVRIEKAADLYPLLAEAEYLIGVFSTAIFEGFAFGCKAILCDLPGIEYMEGLIADYGIPVCRGDDLGEILRSHRAPQVPANRFF